MDGLTLTLDPCKEAAGGQQNGLTTESWATAASRDSDALGVTPREVFRPGTAKSYAGKSHILRADLIMETINMLTHLLRQAPQQQQEPNSMFMAKAVTLAAASLHYNVTEANFPMTIGAAGKANVASAQQVFAFLTQGTPSSVPLMQALSWQVAVNVVRGDAFLGPRHAEYRVVGAPAAGRAPRSD